MNISDVYVAALVDGLVPSGQIQLDGNSKKLLQQARSLLQRPELPEKLHPLLAITGQVWDSNIKQYFQPGRLKLDDTSSVFPQQPGVLPPVPDGLGGLIYDEINQAVQLFNDNSAAFRYTLYHTIYAWGARIAFGDSDVSVFDHNRLLAATVQCLRKNTRQEEPEFLLVKGAVSGIQPFIYYDIGGEQIDDAKKASKRLRGRSFLVAHSCQAVAEYLVEHLELEQANILFVGGGHFNLLLPDTEETRTNLAHLQKQLNMGIFKSMGMQLNLLLAWVKAGAGLFQNANAYYRLVSDRLEHQKQRRYIDHLAEFFDRKGAHRDYEEYKKVEQEHEQIGTLTPYAEFLLEVRSSETGLRTLWEVLDKDKEWQNKAIATFQFMGRHYYVIKKERAWQSIREFTAAYGPAIYEHGGSLKVTRLNSTDFMPDAPLSLPVGVGFEFIGNEAPMGKGKNKKEEDVVSTFEEIAKMGGEDFPQLAAMRLDVDDLGVLFQYGLGKNVSFERIASLSREFQLFFGGYFNILAREHDLYITYSGGDDAFVIGSRLNVVRFAHKLDQEFRKFTCNNEHIGFSAGIFLCSPFYPVVRFAEDAKHLLEKKAKEHEVEKSVGKNAVNLFNQTLDWKRFGKMMEFAETLSKVVPREDEEGRDGRSGTSIRRSMLQHFLGTIQASKKGKDDYEFYRNLGRLHGLVSRHGYRKEQLEKKLKDKEPAAEIIETLLKASGSKEQFADYIVPLQYVLHQTRVKNK